MPHRDTPGDEKGFERAQEDDIMELHDILLVLALICFGLAVCSFVYKKKVLGIRFLTVFCFCTCLASTLVAYDSRYGPFPEYYGFYPVTFGFACLMLLFYRPLRG